MNSMIDVRNYTNLDDLIDEALKRIALNKIAEKLGITPASCHATVHGARHRVYKQLKGWKLVFKVRRQQGAYLELLAIVRAYPYYSQKQEMLERAYHLLGRLQEDIETEWTAVTGLLYTLDPLVPTHLREMIDFPNFPAEEEAIPAFVDERIVWTEDLNGPRRLFRNRIARTWAFMRRIDAVRFDKKTGCWQRLSPLAWEPLPNETLRNDLVKMRHHLYLQEFSSLLFDRSTLFASTDILAVPESNLPVIREILEEQARETLDMVRLSLNAEALEGLRGTDEARYRKALAFKEALSAKGVFLDPAAEPDRHCLIRVASLGRQVTQCEPHLSLLEID